MNRRYLLALIVLFLLAGCSVGRGCRPDVPPSPTVTPTIAPPPTIAATVTPEPSKTPVAPTFTPTAIVTPLTPTATPTDTPPIVVATETATATSATPQATPALLGRHTVVRGDTMFGVGLEWYAGRYFAWGEDVWRPICTANPEIADCRVIYPGDILRIPKLP